MPCPRSSADDTDLADGVALDDALLPSQLRANHHCLYSAELTSQYPNSVLWIGYKVELGRQGLDRLAQVTCLTSGSSMYPDAFAVQYALID